MSEATHETPRCYRHPDRETLVSCSECGRPICEECMTFAPDITGLLVIDPYNDFISDRR